jgi:hypothetical protein
VDECLHGPDTEGQSPRTVVHLHDSLELQRALERVDNVINRTWREAA